MKTTMFKDDMLIAFLDGRKIQTRRLNGLKEINNNPHWYKEVQKMCVNKKGQTVFAFKKYEHWINKSNEYCTKVDCAKSPYKVGDIVGIRENYELKHIYDTSLTVVIKYLFDNKEMEVRIKESDNEKLLNWKKQLGKKSKLFMFDSLIRHTLEITDIRVERIQDITSDDIIAEGIKWNPNKRAKQDYFGKLQYERKIKIEFQNLWDSINKKRGYEWDVNPFCWVVEFKKIT